jgi:hypothetical protein
MENGARSERGKDGHQEAGTARPILTGGTAAEA